MTDETIKRPELNREIATTLDGRDITRGFSGPLLMPSDRLVRTRGMNDWLIYEAIYSDPQVKATFEQRQSAVTRCEWKVEAASDRRVDKKAAEFLERQLKAIRWDDKTRLMLFGVFYGFAVAEIIYGRDGDMVTIAGLKVRNRRRFRFAEDGSLRLLTPENMLEGEPAQAPYFWHFATGADNDDDPYGLGLGHWCYWPVLFKRNGIKFWLVFLEKFGMPTAVGKYDPGASAEERAKLLAATQAIQTDAGIIMPKEMELELLEAARSGTVDYKTLHDTMDETIAKAVLGQTMTTEDGSSKSQADVHHDVRQDIVKADADLVCESFNLGPALWLTRFNFPDADPPRVHREVEEPEDLTERAKRDEIVVGFGFRPTLDYVKDTYGGEWVEKEAPADDVDPATGKPRTPPLQLAQFAEADAASVLTDRLAELLDDATSAELSKWVGEVRALLEEAGSLEQFRDRLLERFGALKTEVFQALMADALLAGHLGGQAAVLDAIGVPNTPISGS